MDAKAIEQFLRAHGPAAVIVALAVAPAVWGFCSNHHGQQIDYLNERLANTASDVETVESKREALSRDFAAMQVRFEELDASNRMLEDQHRSLAWKYDQIERELKALREFKKRAENLPTTRASFSASALYTPSNGARRTQ